MIGTFRKKIEQKKGTALQIKKELNELLSKQMQFTQEVNNTEAAQIIIQIVAQKTQQELEFRLSELCSMALAAVFENPYKLKINFEIKRGKTECKILFERGGEEFDPLFSSGGGAIDVAAMALRITMNLINKPAYRNILILDEPFRFLSEKYHEKASSMLSEISKRLSLQIIMVTHLRGLVHGADKVFHILQNNGVSAVLLNKNNDEKK